MLLSVWANVLLAVVVKATANLLPADTKRIRSKVEKINRYVLIMGSVLLFARWFYIPFRTGTDTVFRAWQIIPRKQIASSLDMYFL